MLQFLAFVVFAAYAVVLVNFIRTSYTAYKINRTARQLTKDIQATKAWLDAFSNARRINVADL